MAGEPQQIGLTVCILLLGYNVFSDGEILLCNSPLCCCASVNRPTVGLLRTVLCNPTHAWPKQTCVASHAWIFTYGAMPAYRHQMPLKIKARGLAGAAFDGAGLAAGG